MLFYRFTQIAWTVIFVVWSRWLHLLFRSISMNENSRNFSSRGKRKYNFVSRRSHIQPYIFLIHSIAIRTLGFFNQSTFYILIFLHSLITLEKMPTNGGITCENEEKMNFIELLQTRNSYCVCSVAVCHRRRWNKKKQMRCAWIERRRCVSGAQIC